MAVSSQKADEPITEINITPLVDVCLVLVIIFMAVAPFALVAGIKVLESRAKASEGKVDLNENVRVKLTEAGVVTVNDTAVPEGGLSAAIASALHKSRDKMVTVTADDGNRVGQVVEILDTARQSGAQKLAILRTEEEKTPEGAQGG
ncbi:MAG: biopolymer transporter ExbD [Elusimicrobia bacterium]|nr:biopolymer transporter ExbD [Elusimicrobiota bacterium]